MADSGVRAAFPTCNSYGARPAPALAPYDPSASKDRSNELTVTHFHCWVNPVIIEIMRSDRESVEQWCERAIVMHSLAAAEEEALVDTGNVTAKRVARKHADETAEELAQALAALQAARREIAG